MIEQTQQYDMKARMGQSTRKKSIERNSPTKVAEVYYSV